MTYVAQSTCRSCNAYCPVNVTIDNGIVLKVEGNPDAPLYEGFICPKGRAITAEHSSSTRLTRTLKRMPDGSQQPISNERLVEEISVRLRDIVDKYGPRSVAAFLGSGPTITQPAAAAMSLAFMAALGSNSFFSDNTIDQPGILVAEALHGNWAGGRLRPEKLEVFLMVGGNPIISKQYFSQNPGQQLKRFIKNGMKLIVIDPRRTETARRAHVHLQCIPGEDPSIIAGLIHLVIKTGLTNRRFVDLNAEGFDELWKAVSAFTPEYVAARAGVDQQGLREAARFIGEAKTGDFGSGVGPTMATRGTLTVYLMRCLQTLRGFWASEGDEAIHPRVLMPRVQFKAQPAAPRAAWGFGRKMRIRGLQQTVAGMPTAALPEEILTPGEGQIRALFLHSGAMLTWPQQDLAKKALESLDLLVMHDVELSTTSRVASYIIPTKLQLEIPAISQLEEQVSTLHPGYGWAEPYAAYHRVVLNPPEGSDILDAWQIYYRLAQKLGLKLRFSGFLDVPSTASFLDMVHEPSTDDLYEILCQGSAIPLSEVKKYPNGKLFDEAREIVGPRDPDCTARFDLANPYVLEELHVVRSESIAARRGTNQDFPFLLTPRRIQNATNTYVPKSIVRTSYNPAYMNSSDLENLRIRPGDMVEIRSRHGAIVGFVDIDDDLRPGVLSMCHGYGKNPGDDYNPRRDGANVNRLIHWEDDYDPYNGMPRMGAVPISVKPIPC